MPKRANVTVAWLDAQKIYEVREDGRLSAMPDAAAWARWLEEHGSFAFHGQRGRLNLLKEQRRAGPGYWYAYRRQGGRVAKRYAGRSIELTFARLEALAQLLGGSDGILVPQPAVHKPSAELTPAAEPLLAPKLQPPRLHSTLVRRQRLLSLLDAGRERKLTLLSAPAGFGKTTLVRQWLADAETRGSAPAIAWLALDAGDNDPLRFWRYIVAACRAFGPELGTQSLALLDAPIALKSPLDMILTALVNELAQLTRECVLVLEDYHLITTPQIHDSVALLLEHLPPRLHLLIISRTQPPLPLPRMAAAGELTTVEAPELRFSNAETEIFLEQATVLALQPGAIELLEGKLEGWVAGLRMFALALEGRNDAGDIDLILENFVAGRRGIGEYFVAEVLNKQPALVQQFLLQTSFLARLTASLCNSVTRRHNSEALLEMLEQANLFIEPLDGAGLWYRYHALFATAMQGEARRRLGDAAVRDLLDRAGRWYEANALLPEAVEAALLAGDHERAAELIEIVAKPQFSNELTNMHGPPEFHSLQHWLTQLPTATLDAHPLLNLALAVAILFTSFVEMQPIDWASYATIEQLLNKAERAFRASGNTDRQGQIHAFRALMFRQRGEFAAAVGWAKAALALLQPEELNWRSVCIGGLAMGEQYAGALGNACALFVQAQAMCEQLGNQPFARANGGMLGGVLLEQNDLHRAARIFEQIQAEARTVSDFDDIAHTAYGLGDIALRWSDLDAAQARAEEVLVAVQQFPHDGQHIVAKVLLAHIEQARGDHAAALARCTALLGEIKPAVLPREKQLAAHAALEQARIAFRAGEFALVQRWRATRATGVELSRLHRDREQILLARLTMAEGSPEAAVRALEALLAAAEADGCAQIALEARVPLVLALAATGKAEQARHMLAAALASAQPANARYVFVAESETLAPLLRATVPMLTGKNLIAFARSILASIAPADVETDLLSPQERRVLRMIVAGRSNPQIADELVVSVNTVKAHIKNIYRKLNVSTRLGAARAARDLDLG